MTVLESDSTSALLSEDRISVRFVGLVPFLAARVFDLTFRVSSAEEPARGIALGGVRGGSDVTEALCLMGLLSEARFRIVNASGRAAGCDEEPETVCSETRGFDVFETGRDRRDCFAWETSPETWLLEGRLRMATAGEGSRSSRLGWGEESV